MRSRRRHRRKRRTQGSSSQSADAGHLLESAQNRRVPPSSRSRNAPPEKHWRAWRGALGARLVGRGARRDSNAPERDSRNLRTREHRFCRNAAELGLWRHHAALDELHGHAQLHRSHAIVHGQHCPSTPRCLRMVRHAGLGTCRLHRLFRARPRHGALAWRVFEIECRT